MKYRHRPDGISMTSPSPLPGHKNAGPFARGPHRAAALVGSKTSFSFSRAGSARASLCSSRSEGSHRLLFTRVVRPEGYLLPTSRPLFPPLGKPVFPEYPAIPLQAGRSRLLNGAKAPMIEAEYATDHYPAGPTVRVPLPAELENRSQDNGLRAGPGAKTMPLRKPSPLRRELAARSQKEATCSRSPSGSLEGNILEAPIRRDHLGTNFLPVKRAPVSQILRHLDPIAQFMAP